MKIFKIIMALIIATVLVAPVMAYSIYYPAPLIDESIHASSNGDYTTQNLVNNVEFNAFDERQYADATQIGGNGNSMDVINVNGNGNINGNNNIGTAIDNNYNLITEHIPNYYKLDIGVITKQIVSLYSGEVLVASNDDDKNIIQREGDKFVYTIKSSLPVLAYVVNANEADRAEFDNLVAPVYDPYMHKFELANLDTIYVGKYRSPQQQFEVTIPENGRYALVIDTRVSQSLNGKSIHITEDSVDVVYSIEKTKDGISTTNGQKYIGSISIYPVLSNGMADTSK